jgi:hypothetical protein
MRIHRPAVSGYGRRGAPGRAAEDSGTLGLDSQPRFLPSARAADRGLLVTSKIVPGGRREGDVGATTGWRAGVLPEREP